MKSHKQALFHVWMILYLILLAGCTPAAAVSTPDLASHAATAAAVQERLTPSAQPTIPVLPTKTLSATPVPTLVPVIKRVCSPLQDVELDELEGIISNPYDPPTGARDDGHHGVDFAYYRFKERVGMTSLPIHAVLPGRVIAALPEQFPYGYTIIIETPLEHLDPQWISRLNLPQPLDTPVENPGLDCPPFEVPPVWDFDHLSLYTLYAHMVEPTGLTVGQQAACGDVLGGVGSTGGSVNDHLHFEVRIGPGGASFASMSHYGTNTSEEDRQNYCLWRLSRLFLLVDPMLILSLD